MPTIQAFLTVLLCNFVWLTIILALGLGEEITTYDRDRRAKERTQDGTIYTQDWNLKGGL